MSKVENATIHNDLGESVARDQLIHWGAPDGSLRRFLPTSLTWTVDGEPMCISMRASLNVWVLPDDSGLICFEGERSKDNCYVLDAYGSERCRLRVPWELTPYDVPSTAKMWFRNIGVHPDGEFGVTAWIEYAGDFYFELDYREGRFLWGKEIRF